MKKLIFFIFATILLFSLVGIVSAEMGKITAYVVNSGQDNENGNNGQSNDNQTNGVENQEQNQSNLGMMVGNDSDEHGCKASAGYTYCDKKSKCIRSWEENCTNVKIMPSTASATAIARLGIKNCNESEGCTIVLKETGSGNETKATYEVKAKKEAKLFGFIKTHMDVTAEVDAETGNVTSTHKPFWAFLAKEE